MKMGFKMMLISVFLVTFFMIEGYSQSNTNYKGSYEVVLEIDRQGEVISGSREKLIDYVQQGNPIRVGWKLVFRMPESDSTQAENISLFHWSDAGFISILKGEVFAQIRSIYEQGPSMFGTPSIHLGNGGPDGWVAIIGTTGIMRQQFKNTENIPEDILKQMKSTKVNTRWAVMKER